MTQKRPLRTALSLIGYLLCALLGLMLLCNLVIIIQGVISPNTPPSVLGITPMVVQSGSMSGSAEGHIEVGDLILVGPADPETLQIGDVITFREDAVIVTHRIVDIRSGADGSRQFITKGDANNIEDELPVTADRIIGQLRSRIPHVGNFATFLQKPLGMVIFIGIPLCAFLMYDIFRRQRRAHRENQENAALKAELEQLRSANDQSKPE